MGGGGYSADIYWTIGVKFAEVRRCPQTGYLYNKMRPVMRGIARIITIKNSEPVLDDVAMKDMDSINSEARSKIAHLKNILGQIEVKLKQHDSGGVSSSSEEEVNMVRELAYFLVECVFGRSRADFLSTSSIIF